MDDDAIPRGFDGIPEEAALLGDVAFVPLQHIPHREGARQQSAGELLCVCCGLYWPPDDCLDFGRDPSGKTYPPVCLACIRHKRRDDEEPTL